MGDIDQLRPIFDTLKPDTYLQKMLKESEPTRYRLFRQVRVNLLTDRITLTDNRSLKQQVGDFRQSERIFELVPDCCFSESGRLSQLIGQASRYSQHYDRIDGELICNVHFVRQVARCHQTATNAPEGRHQDGADFIVSAFVVNLSNVEGGISQVGTREGFNYFEKQLQPGEGLLHDDRDYHHDITRIRALDSSKDAIRDIIGFDFIFEAVV
jgi:hypothetical protein